MCVSEMKLYVYLGITCAWPDLYLQRCDLRKGTLSLSRVYNEERVNGTLPSDFACALSERERALQMVMLDTVFV